MIDPRAMAILQSAVIKPRFCLKLHHLDPSRMEPIGDRYVYEELDVDEAIEFGKMLVMTEALPKPGEDPRSPLYDPNIEHRGVIPGVIVAKGDGHLLGLPDPRIAVGDAHGNQHVRREPADVPMFLRFGDVVLVDRTAKGRALRMAGRTLRIANQIDFLIKLDLRLQWKDGGWEPEESE